MNSIKYFGIRFARFALPVAASMVAFQASAQGAATTIGGVQSIICTLLSLAFWFFFVVAIVFVLLAAFNYLTASGDPEKVKKASHMLLYAAIGIAVALIARSLPYFVSSLVPGSGGQIVSTC